MDASLASAAPPPSAVGGHRGLLSKIPFMRSHGVSQASHQHQHQPPPEGQVHGTVAGVAAGHIPSPSPIPTALQQQKTRRRRGSLRKVALLGRGAQRERRDMSDSSAAAVVASSDVSLVVPSKDVDSSSNSAAASSPPTPSPVTAATQTNANGADSSPGSNVTGKIPHPPNQINVTKPVGVKSRSTSPSAAAWSALPPIDIPPNTRVVEESSTATASYSTTDDEDTLRLPRRTSNKSSLLRPGIPSTSGSESYFSGGLPAPRASLQRRRSGNRVRSPLALGSLNSSPMNSGGLIQQASEWDYDETERWGWIILFITWFVFVMGMGSVTGIWSWVWDVGPETVYPAWLEAWDDPTLPIEGYYPSLLLLTCVMVWVWVVVSWMGMKYFRHAKINGDH
ncbi:hypothetical protein MCOR25_006252 [Pyricularia grisea]|uniref:Uncharacterized protein n=1 Tax=Pyricularia grisea TaxID=148305 RepID=A0A6P8B5H9_PYRGI|nr:hypothetical protein PgNI_05602 [Pyricularia grisea]KAI6362304.1 hypothetical protein MCOR25_006252 [Pyricularia grisea]TLD10547.1 hypothetical protein PgNI_05602 [Pyricularia grisea]